MTVVMKFIFVALCLMMSILRTEQKLVRMSKGGATSAQAVNENKYNIGDRTKKNKKKSFQKKDEEKHVKKHQARQPINQQQRDTTNNQFNDLEEFWFGLLNESIPNTKYIELMRIQEALRMSYFTNGVSNGKIITKYGNKFNNVKQLIRDCDSYTRNSTLNDNIKCSNGLLARSGAKYLRKFLPPTNDVPGYAKLRILDSFVLTDGTDACEFTDNRDGRHFFPLDFLKLRAIAEGVIDVFGATSDREEEEDNEDEPLVSEQHETQRQIHGDDIYQLKTTSTRANPTSMIKEEPMYQLLVSGARAKELAETRQVGKDFYDILKLAFKNRYLAFAGDSTTCCLRHHLVAYLKVMSSDLEVDQVVREKLEFFSSSSSPSWETAIKVRGLGHNDVGSDGSLGSSGGAKVEELFTWLKKDCPSESKLPDTAYFGGRCSYIKRTSSCPKGFGCSPHVTVDDIEISLSVHSHLMNKGALNAIPSNPNQSFVMKELMTFEKFGIPSHQASQTSTSLQPIDKYVKKTTTPTTTTTAGNSVEENKITKKKKQTILIVHGGFHYLHLFPAREFEGFSGLNLGHYQQNMISALNKLRHYLGPDSLVIWATVGNVCDEKMRGLYASTLARLKEGMV